MSHGVMQSMSHRTEGWGLGLYFKIMYVELNNVCAENVWKWWRKQEYLENVCQVQYEFAKCHIWDVTIMWRAEWGKNFCHGEFEIFNGC